MWRVWVMRAPAESACGWRRPLHRAFGLRGGSHLHPDYPGDVLCYLGYCLPPALSAAPGSKIYNVKAFVA
ncbi:hypothetical protein GCM10027570_42220 [Streptomonospora sediminis]